MSIYVDVEDVEARPKRTDTAHGSVSDHAYGSVRLCALEQAQETRGFQLSEKSAESVPSLPSLPLVFSEAHEKSEALDV